METGQGNPTIANQPSFADRMQHSKPLVAIAAVLGVTVAALATALVVNKSDAQPGATSATAPVALAAPGLVPAPVTAPARKVAAVPKVSTTTASSQPTTIARANVCADCGTVERVTAVKRPGKVNGVAVGGATIGLGTVAGGVLGGLLGHQVGNGNGRTAAALLGAAGGAYAGNKIEQNMQTVTVYDVQVKMDNGAVRNLDISTAPAIGAKVIVEGNNLRMATAKG